MVDEKRIRLWEEIKSLSDKPKFRRFKYDPSLVKITEIIGTVASYFTAPATDSITEKAKALIKKNLEDTESAIRSIKNIADAEDAGLYIRNEQINLIVGSPGLFEDARNMLAAINGRSNNPLNLQLQESLTDIAAEMRIALRKVPGLGKKRE